MDRKRNLFICYFTKGLDVSQANVDPTIVVSLSDDPRVDVARMA